MYVTHFGRYYSKSLSICVYMLLRQLVSKLGMLASLKYLSMPADVTTNIRPCKCLAQLPAIFLLNQVTYSVPVQLVAGLKMCLLTEKIT